MVPDCPIREDGVVSSLARETSGRGRPESAGIEDTDAAWREFDPSFFLEAFRTTAQLLPRQPDDFRRFRLGPIEQHCGSIGRRLYSFRVCQVREAPPRPMVLRQPKRLPEMAHQDVDSGEHDPREVGESRGSSSRMRSNAAFGRREERRHAGHGDGDRCRLALRAGVHPPATHQAGKHDPCGLATWAVRVRNSTGELDRMHAPNPRRNDDALSILSIECRRRDWAFRAADRCPGCRARGPLYTGSGRLRLPVAGTAEARRWSARARCRDPS